MKLKIGDKAPSFTGLNQKEEQIALKDYLGRKLVLYFYPKDDTPGCTEQSCSLRDHYQELRDKNVAILGVSADGVKSHSKFARKYKLPFDLLADEDRKAIEAYGVWGEKMLFGRKYMGIIRTTFLIDEKGKIEAIIDKVNTKEASEQILELL